MKRMESTGVVGGALSPPMSTQRCLRTGMLSSFPLRTCSLRIRDAPIIPRRHHCPVLFSSSTDASSVDDLEENQLVSVDIWKQKLQKATENLKGDLFGGFTASVVALPLALAFGVASGAGPIAGLYGATFAGFFAALFGGTPAQVTGPTGPMTVVAATIFSTYTSDPTHAFSVVVLAGIFQIIMGAMKLGRFIRLVPAPVISGFMSGIGCIILSTQLLPLCGLRAAPDALTAIRSIPTLLSKMNFQAFFIGALSFALCTFTPKKLTRIVPGSLLALTAATAVTSLAGFNLPLLGNIPTQLPAPLSLKFPAGLFPAMLKSGFILSLLGTIDSLLTSLVADNLTDTFHDSNKEMVGQGIGNAIAGLFGGIPSAGATMRTVVNIRSGGRTPLSGMFHSLLLLIVLMGGGGMAKSIPLASLAGILMKTGWDIVDDQFIVRLTKLPISTGIVMWTVLLMTVFVDLIVAVAAGSVLASLLLVNQMANTEVERCAIVTASNVDEESAHSEMSPLEKSLIQAGGDVLGVVKIHGSFTFSAANGILRKVVPAMSPLKTVVLDLSEVILIDGDAILAIETLEQKSDAAEKLFVICGASPEICALMEKSGLTTKLPFDPSTHRTKCIYQALKETLGEDLPPFPEAEDLDSNNAVDLSNKVRSPATALPLVSTSDAATDSMDSSE